MSLNVQRLRILYLTPSNTHGNTVGDFVKNNKFENDISHPFVFSWSLIDTPLMIFSCVNELFKSNCKRLTVIIDYQAIWKNCTKNIGEYYVVLRDTILFFPEFNFVFDEEGWKNDSKTGKYGFADFLWKASSFRPFGEAVRNTSGIPLLIQAHQFKFNITPTPTTQNPFKELLLGHDNFFDASNLRYFLKKHKYSELSLKENFSSIQTSRAKNLALCVEEERSQSLFNSLALYLNGFRVLPITSATELNWANDNLTPEIIIRDYDLQFPDTKLLSDKNKTDYEIIYLVRGWHYDSKNKKWECTLNDENNIFWSRLWWITTFYVSKGTQDKDGKRNMFCHIHSVPKEKHQDKISGVGTSCLHLSGIYKPVSGVYKPFHVINIIRNIYEDSHQSADCILTNRTEEGGHGVPLNIYNMVNDMVERAELYYSNERFVHSVIVASEAIEIMNGFHQSLTIRAYRCQVLAENAVAANILGGDEQELKNDTEFRLKKIERDITRISSIGDYEDVHNINKRKNMLNQIYNDIRIFCKDREHFKAEDVVVREIGHLNEGLPLFVLKNYITKIIKGHRNE